MRNRQHKKTFLTKIVIRCHDSENKPSNNDHCLTMNHYLVYNDINTPYLFTRLKSTGFPIPLPPNTITFYIHASVL